MSAAGSGGGAAFGGLPVSSFVKVLGSSSVADRYRSSRRMAELEADEHNIVLPLPPQVIELTPAEQRELAILNAGAAGGTGGGGGNAASGTSVIGGIGGGVTKMPDSAYVSADTLEALRLVGSASRDELDALLKSLPAERIRKFLSAQVRAAAQARVDAVVDEAAAATQNAALAAAVAAAAKKAAATDPLPVWTQRLHATVSADKIAAARDVSISARTLVPAVPGSAPRTDRADEVPYAVWCSVLQYVDTATMWFSAMLVSRAWRRAVLDPNAWLSVQFTVPGTGLVRQFPSPQQPVLTPQRVIPISSWVSFWSNSRLTKNTHPSKRRSVVDYMSRWFASWWKVKSLEFMPRATPIVEHFLTHCRHLRHVSMLHGLSSSIGEVPIKSILNTPCAKNLHTLLLPGRNFRDQDLRDLVKACPQLQSLALIQYTRYVTNWQPLRALLHLRELTLHQCRTFNDAHLNDLTVDADPTLADVPGDLVVVARRMHPPPPLARLSLMGATLTAQGLSNGMRGLRHLTHLDLSETRQPPMLQGHNLELIANNMTRNVKELVWRDTCFGDNEAAILCPSMPQLEVLIAAGACSDRGLMQISYCCRKLRVLSLQGTGMPGFTDRGLCAVARRCRLLESLHVGPAFISDTSMYVIGRSLKRLRSLVLSGAALVTDTGVGYLAPARTLLLSRGNTEWERRARYVNDAQDARARMRYGVDTTCTVTPDGTVALSFAAVLAPTSTAGAATAPKPKMKKVTSGSAGGEGDASPISSDDDIDRKVPGPKLLLKTSASAATAAAVVANPRAARDDGDDAAATATTPKRVGFTKSITRVGSRGGSRGGSNRAAAAAAAASPRSVTIPRPAQTSQEMADEQALTRVVGGITMRGSRGRGLSSSHVRAAARPTVLRLNARTGTHVAAAAAAVPPPPGGWDEDDDSGGDEDAQGTRVRRSVGTPFGVAAPAGVPIGGGGGAAPLPLPGFGGMAVPPAFAGAAAGAAAGAGGPALVPRLNIMPAAAPAPVPGPAGAAAAAAAAGVPLVSQYAGGGGNLQMIGPRGNIIVAGNHYMATDVNGPFAASRAALPYDPTQQHTTVRVSPNSGRQETYVRGVMCHYHYPLRGRSVAVSSDYLRRHGLVPAPTTPAAIFAAQQQQQQPTAVVNGAPSALPSALPTGAASTSVVPLPAQPLAPVATAAAAAGATSVTAAAVVAPAAAGGESTGASSSTAATSVAGTPMAAAAAASPGVVVASAAAAAGVIPAAAPATTDTTTDAKSPAADVTNVKTTYATVTGSKTTAPRDDTTAAAGAAAAAAAPAAAAAAAAPVGAPRAQGFTIPLGVSVAAGTPGAPPAMAYARTFDPTGTRTTVRLSPSSGRQETLVNGIMIGYHHALINRTVHTAPSILARRGLMPHMPAPAAAGGVPVGAAGGGAVGAAGGAAGAAFPAVGPPMPMRRYYPPGGDDDTDTQYHLAGTRAGASIAGGFAGGLAAATAAAAGGAMAPPPPVPAGLLMGRGGGGIGLGGPRMMVPIGRGGGGVGFGGGFGAGYAAAMPAAPPPPGATELPRPPTDTAMYGELQLTRCAEQFVQNHVANVAAARMAAFAPPRPEPVPAAAAPAAAEADMELPGTNTDTTPAAADKNKDVKADAAAAPAGADAKAATATDLKSSRHGTHTHPLTLMSGPARVRAKTERKNVTTSATLPSLGSSFACDLCRQNHDAATPSFHCAQCDYDECLTCYHQQRTAAKAAAAGATDAAASAAGAAAAATVAAAAAGSGMGTAGATSVAVAGLASAIAAVRPALMTAAAVVGPGAPALTAGAVADAALAAAAEWSGDALSSAGVPYALLPQLLPKGQGARAFEMDLDDALDFTRDEFGSLADDPVAAACDNVMPSDEKKKDTGRYQSLQALLVRDDEAKHKRLPSAYALATAKFIDALARPAGLSDLTHLSVAHCPNLTRTSLAHVSRLPSLRVLNVHGVPNLSLSADLPLLMCSSTLDRVLIKRMSAMSGPNTPPHVAARRNARNAVHERALEQVYASGVLIHENVSNPMAYFDPLALSN